MEVSSLTDTEHQHDTIEDLVAPLMFGLSLTFLALLAATLVLWVEPWGEYEQAGEASRQVSSESIGESDGASERFVVRESMLKFQATAHALGNWSFRLQACLWPFFLLEQLYHLLRRRSWTAFQARYPFWWLYLLFPPLRMCAQRRGEINEVWLPRWGWQTVDRGLRRKLERVFSIPMIWIALLILPVLGLPFLFKDLMSESPWLRALIHLGTGVIWFAFTVEFIVMVSVARNKLNYCKEHWLDLAIILLPFVSFLRSLQFLRASKLVNASRLSQLAKMVRAYRVRGVAMRGFRALMVLELIHRLLRSTPDGRIAKLQRQREEKLRELEEIDEQIASLQLAASQAADSQVPGEDCKSERDRE